MNGNRMFELAQGLAVAKSRRDVAAALTFLDKEMVLEGTAFGTLAKGHAENEAALSRFFKAFPDYNVVLNGHANDGKTLVCWGTGRMTMTGDRFGVSPNGKRADLPVFIKFTFRNDLIASEYFFFDLSTLCAQSGVSTDEVRRKLFGEPFAKAA
jgi:predicted ester cyclase